jgi:NitT/TauT family transport system substrate-binding protein
MTQLEVVLPFTPNTQSFGPYWALKQGLYAKAGLNVTLIPAGATTNQPAVVAAGQAQIGITNAQLIISGIAAGAKLTIFAADMPVDTTALTCRKSAGVTKLSQVAGKTVGVISPENDQLNLLLKKNGINPSTVKEVPIPGGDISNIIAGKIDCQYPTAGFNEPNEIAAAGVPTNYFLASSYGLPSQFDDYFTTKSFISSKSNQAALTKFISATAAGWADLIKNPDAAAKWFINEDLGTGLTLSHEEYRANYIAKALVGPSTKANGLLSLIPSVWTQTAQEMATLGLTKSTIDIASDLDTSIVAAAKTPKI